MSENTKSAGVAEKAAPVKTPKPIRLLQPYGFIGESGANHRWDAGQIVTDPAEIEILTKRGAHFEVI